MMTDVAFRLAQQIGKESTVYSMTCFGLHTCLANNVARASAVPLYEIKCSAGAQCWNSCSQLEISEDGTTTMKGPEVWQLSTRCASSAMTCKQRGTLLC